MRCEFCGREMSVEEEPGMHLHNLYEVGSRYACPQCDKALLRMYQMCALKYMESKRKRNNEI